MSVNRGSLPTEPGRSKPALPDTELIDDDAMVSGDECA